MLVGEDMDELQHEYFLFLNRLRESGVTNMFGAGRYLAKHYDLSHRVAGKILI